MYRDLNGDLRLKINLHTHTNRTDGQVSPERAAELYREAGYDTIALTDHFVIGMGETLSGLPILPGCEFDNSKTADKEGVFHIVAIGYERAPEIVRGMSPKAMIDAIHDAGGFAILAHPEWSLDTVEQIFADCGALGADASEIYNTVSDFGMSYRADSSAILDRCALKGHAFPLVAADDAHYYTGDHCRSYLMVKCEENSRAAIVKALKQGDYYATQGPEIHAWIEDEIVHVRTSPVNRVNFHSSHPWTNGAVVRGYHLTEATFDLHGRMPKFLRVSCVDDQGRQAWTSFLLPRS